METLDTNQKDLDKLKDFLQKAKVSKYFEAFTQHGVYRVKDLQDYVKEGFLIEINMSQPERERFWKYVNQSRPPWWNIKKMFRKSEPAAGPIYDEIGAFSVMPISEGAKLISHQELVELGVIGKGTFGEVSRGMWHYKPTMPPRPVAVKIVSAVTEANRDQIMREAEVWNRLDHENIIKLYGVTFTKPFKMIMELANKGSLDKYLRTKVNQMSIERMWNFSEQIASGMEYLHSKRIIHRDLACRNVLMINDTQVKISDFGMTRFLPNENDMMQTLTPHKVPFAWTSIEVLETGQYSNASDVWGFGVTIWEIYSYGDKPWSELSMPQVTLQLQLEKRLDPPLLSSDEIFKLMTACWTKDPNDRPCFGQILAQLKIVKPEKVIAKLDSPSNIDEDQCVPYKKNDFICIIEKNLKEHWTGQNQSNLKTGFILAGDMETDQKKIEAYKKNLLKRKPRLVDMKSTATANYLNIDLFQPIRDKVDSYEYEDIQIQQIRPKTNLFPNNFDIYFAPDELTNEDTNEEDPYNEDIYFAPDELNYEDSDSAPELLYQNYITQTVKESSTPIFPSVNLVDRLKISDSYAYTTMMPGGIGGIGGTSGRDKNGDKGVARDPKEMDRYYFRKSQAEDDGFDPYVIHERETRKDTDGYDLPFDDDTKTTITTTTTNTEAVTTIEPLRKISKFGNTNSFFDEPILNDSALTPDQLNRRKRASLCRNAEPIVLKNSPKIPATNKPLLPIKPLGINYQRTGSMNKIRSSSKPLNTSILATEFPDVPENEISVILNMFQGSLKEARKDLKFKLFREQMQEEIPMLTSVRCYEVFKKYDFNSENAKKELFDNPPMSPRGFEQYEWLN